MKLIKTLYVWILIALVLGILFGIFFPTIAMTLEPLGTNFIKIIKVFIGPIVFLTIATGIAQLGSLKKLGKTSLKALIYFEIVSTIALFIGWAMALIIKPGSAFHPNLNNFDHKSISQFVAQAQHLSFVEFISSIIPSNFIEPFTSGNMLQILLLAVLFGCALLTLGERHTQTFMTVMTSILEVFFKMFGIAMYAAPIGVFGAIAFAVGKFGSSTLIPLLILVATFYLTSIIFIFGVLGTIAKIAGFSLLRFLRLMLPELIFVLGTSSSESALPQLLRKLEKIGCTRETVGLVVPLGYSFNLDGTNIYITLAALFIAQALGIPLTFEQQLILFATATLTSKGAAGITGAGFITLAATLSVVPSIPAIGLVLILGIDRFMSEARSLTNYIGNGVAALVISRLEKEVSGKELNHKMAKYLEGES